jgi:rhodanese-related sulfurtransferase
MISRDSTMQRVLEEFPGAQRALFRKYHIGGCSSCGFQPNETLADLCQRNNNLNVDEVIAHIKESHELDQKMQIAPRELAAELKANGGLKLVDIRTREEHEAVRIDGSILFTQELMQEMLGRWTRTAPLVIYDHLGKKSMDAAAYFAGHGFENVRALKGGIDAWSREVDPKAPRYELES